MSKDIFWYLGAADRETLLSGLLAWLLDPAGSHGLGLNFLQRIWRHMPAMGDLPQGPTIKVEDRMDRDRRFDLSVHDSSGSRVLVIEVKCKTEGTLAQLKRYADQCPVARVGFAEWNWEDLDREQQSQFPLISFPEIVSMMKASLRDVPGDTPHRPFVEELAAHLEVESRFFAELEAYFFGENERVQLPSRPTSLPRYSQRFYSELFWKWFGRRLAQDGRFQNYQWDTKSEMSGVWFSHHRVPKTATQGWVRRLGLNHSVEWWVHVELTDGIVAQYDNDGAGYISLRAQGETAALVEMYGAVAKCPELPAGFRPAPRQPGRASFNVLSRKLKVKDLRYNALVQTLAAFLDE